MAGRPTEYSEDMITRTKEYLELCEDSYQTKVIEEGVDREGKTISHTKTIFKVKLPSIEGLAVHLDINRDTIYDWCKTYPAFSDIIDTLRAKQGEKLLDNGLAGTYNSTIAKVLLTKHGYREGIDATTNDKDLPGITPETQTLVNSVMTQYLNDNKRANS